MSDSTPRIRGTLVARVGKAVEPVAANDGPYLHVFQRPAGSGDAATFVAFALRLVACPLERGWEREREAAEKRYLSVQTDFLNSFYCPDLERALALRYVSQPQPGAVGAGRIEVILLGKQRVSDADQAPSEGRAFFRDLMVLLAGSVPDHEWQVIASEAEFRAVWEPFSWAEAHLAVIRRREDRLQLERLRPRPSLGRGRALAMEEPGGAEGVYVVHPFVPRFSSPGRILRSLLMHAEPVLWQVSLTPVQLGEPEEAAVEEEILKCQAYLDAARGVAAPPIRALTVQERRAEGVLQGFLRQLARLQDAPFQLQLCIASPAALPRTLVETFGVEITGPVTGEPDRPGGGYDVLRPRNPGEAARAADNAHWLESVPWGPSLAPAGLARMRDVVDAIEAAGVFRLPIATGEGLPGIEVRASRSRALPREVAALSQGADAASHLLLGQNAYLGLPQPVRIAARDRRQHMYVVGQTGTGKTTLLRQMILHDMAAGNGLALIDPHGDLFDELMGLVPPHRRNDVVVLDPTDIEFPVGLNILACSDEEERYTVAREMRAVMQRLLEDQYQHQAGEFAGPFFYQHMQMNLLLAMSNPDDPGTLLEFYQIYQSQDYWRRWLPLRWADSKLKRWVSLLEGTNYTKRGNPQEATLGEYLSNKFEDFVFDPRLRLMFGQKRSGFDMQAVMNEGKILLVNLAKGRLAEANTRFLGMVLMSLLQSAAMARVNLPVEERRPFYLYVDEFQSLATENFVLMLSEARKFGLGLVLANQFLSQIRDSRITESIFGNVGTLISFRVSHADAEILETQFAPHFDRHDLTNLSNWTACVKTQVGGRVVPGFTLRPSMPTLESDTSAAQAVREASRRRYGRPRRKVETEIARSLDVPPAPISGGDRATRV